MYAPVVHKSNPIVDHVNILNTDFFPAETVYTTVC